MGIEVGIAVATVGAGKIASKLASKLASKGSKIMQTRHRPVMTKYDEIADLPTKERHLSTQQNPAEVLEQAHIQTGQGNSSVYIGRDAEGKIRYVGRTDRKPEIRFQEHFRDVNKKGIIVEFKTVTNTLDHNSSRAAEQILINKYGMKKMVVT